MISQISYGCNIYAAIQYNEKKVAEGVAERLFSKNFYFDNPRSYVSVLRSHVQDARVDDYTFHVSLNLAHEDRQLSNQEFAAIGAEYMERMGYAENPYVCYRHHDRLHQHIHLVTARTDENGKLINSQFEYTKSMEICHELEVKYGITIVDRWAENKEKQAEKSDLSVDLSGKLSDKKGVRSEIAKIVGRVKDHYKYTNFQEFAKILRLEGVEVKQVKQPSGNTGLVYILQTEYGSVHPVQASEIYHSATFSYIDKRSKANNHKKKNFDKKIVTSLIEKSINGYQKVTQEKFVELCGKKDIKVIFDKYKNGEAYGVSFLHEPSRLMFKGSDLGEYSFKQLQERIIGGHDILEPGNIDKGVRDAYYSLYRDRFEVAGNQARFISQFLRGEDLKVHFEEVTGLQIADLPDEDRRRVQDGILSLVAEKQGLLPIYTAKAALAHMVKAKDTYNRVVNHLISSLPPNLREESRTIKLHSAFAHFEDKYAITVEKLFGVNSLVHGDKSYSEFKDRIHSRLQLDLLRSHIHDCFRQVNISIYDSNKARANNTAARYDRAGHYDYLLSNFENQVAPVAMTIAQQNPAILSLGTEKEIKTAIRSEKGKIAVSAAGFYLSNKFTDFVRGYFKEEKQLDPKYSYSEHLRYLEVFYEDVKREFVSQPNLHEELARFGISNDQKEKLFDALRGHFNKELYLHNFQDRITKLTTDAYLWEKQQDTGYELHKHLLYVHSQFEAVSEIVRNEEAFKAVSQLAGPPEWLQQFAANSAKDYLVRQAVNECTRQHLAAYIRDSYKMAGKGLNYPDFLDAHLKYEEVAAYFKEQNISFIFQENLRDSARMNIEAIFESAIHNQIAYRRLSIPEMQATTYLRTSFRTYLKQQYDSQGEKSVAYSKFLASKFKDLPAVFTQYLNSTEDGEKLRSFGLDLEAYKRVTSHLDELYHQEVFLHSYKDFVRNFTDEAYDLELKTDPSYKKSDHQFYLYEQFQSIAAIGREAMPSWILAAKYEPSAEAQAFVEKFLQDGILNQGVRTYVWEHLGTYISENYQTVKGQISYSEFLDKSVTPAAFADYLKINGLDNLDSKVVYHTGKEQLPELFEKAVTDLVNLKRDKIPEIAFTEGVRHIIKDVYNNLLVADGVGRQHESEYIKQIIPKLDNLAESLSRSDVVNALRDSISIRYGRVLELSEVKRMIIQAAEKFLDNRKEWLEQHPSQSHLAERMIDQVQKFATTKLDDMLVDKTQAPLGIKKKKKKESDKGLEL